MLIPILLILSACLLYTIAIWTEQAQGSLKTRHIFLFGLGFLADILGTSAMFARASQYASGVSLHGICGNLALCIMALHAVWAVWALLKHGRTAALFNRFSPYAWCLWMVAFLTGIPTLNQRLWIVPIVVWCLFVYFNALTQEHRGEIRIMTVPIKACSELLAERHHNFVHGAIYLICWWILSPIASLVWCLLLGVLWLAVQTFAHTSTARK
ncbi:MAG: HsmA family protein [Patescibacteria group bacterium]